MVLGSEVMAFADAFGISYTLKFHVEKVLVMRITLKMINNSKYLFDILTRAMYTTEELIMNNIQSVQDAPQSFEATNNTLVRYEYNSSDTLTKNKAHFNVT